MPPGDMEIYATVLVMFLRIRGSEKWTGIDLPREKSQLHIFLALTGTVMQARMNPFIIHLTQPDMVFRFDNYPEDNASSLYGLPGPDPHGIHFPDFEYTTPSM